jgi:hypothetical protein
MRICKCCGSHEVHHIGELDFNRSCMDRFGIRAFPLSTVLVPYYFCRKCSFVYTEHMDSWTPERFKDEIYNADYLKADPPIPGRVDVPMREQPAYEAGSYIANFFEGSQSDIRVLDFGSGGNPGPTGLALEDRNFQVHSYDPYRSDVSSFPQGRFDLIIAIEVFEHCQDLQALSGFMQDFLADEGLVWIQTMLHPHPTPADVLNSWYIAPRNGHVSIFSLPALTALFRRVDINIVTTSIGLFAFKQLPRYKNSVFVVPPRYSTFLMEAAKQAHEFFVGSRSPRP